VETTGRDPAHASPGCWFAGVVAGLLLWGCATSPEKMEEVRREVVVAADQARTGPKAPPAPTFTSFTPALRCMDHLMLDYGVKSVSVLAEDMHDATKKVNAGARDMLISAVSDMTRRSNAVRLVAYGADSSNTIGFLKEAERKSPFLSVPEFTIRGSVSQLDENLAKRTESAGVQLGPVGGGQASSGSAQVLALDLAVIRTEDLSLLPGVASRNSVVIVRQGAGIDANASATWRSQGLSINFERGIEKSEGTAQALRGLIELAAVELVGRLLKIPYWTCLGADAGNEAVANEITDWYYGLYSSTGALIAYFQWQMKVRGIYEGEIDGEPDESLRNAVSAYRRALGLDPAPRLDQEFFTAYLKADNTTVGAKARGIFASMPRAPIVPKPPPVAAAPGAQADASLNLVLRSNSESGIYERGQEVRLSLAVNRSAYLVCYAEDETGAVQRFFPNRFASGAQFAAGETLQIPGNMPFKLVANNKGLKERILCVASGRDLARELPAKLSGADFSRLPVRSLDEVASAYSSISGTPIVTRMYDVVVR
jgi:peptidoglycan hydrolase-like protein with peptidoglycan-binding domain